MYAEFFRMFEPKNLFGNSFSGNGFGGYGADALQETQRRTMEAFAQAGQLMGESLQAVGRRNADAMREGVEDFLAASRDFIAAGSPEATATKSADYAKSAFESAAGHLREVAEMLTKSGYEAFDVLNQRFAENLQEAGSATGNAAREGNRNFNAGRTDFGSQAKKAAGAK